MPSWGQEAAHHCTLKVCKIRLVPWLGRLHTFLRSAWLSGGLGGAVCAAPPVAALAAMPRALAPQPRRPPVSHLQGRLHIRLLCPRILVAD